MVDAASGSSRRRFVEALRREIAKWEGARRLDQEAPVSSGAAAIDRLLPAGGFHRGTLVEWLAAGDGSGVESLALVAAREACRDGGALVVLDRAGDFYPPAAVRLGIEPQGLIVVRVANEADHAWATDQVLRCPAVAAVVAWPERLEAKTFRRLQLAAEQGGSLGLLIRPERVRHEPSWADVRLLIEPLPTSSPVGDRRLKVQLLRSRGGASGGSVEVEIGDETRTVHLAPQLAAAADHRRAAGA
jgi:hypothetical protein